MLRRQTINEIFTIRHQGEGVPDGRDVAAAFIFTRPSWYEGIMEWAARLARGR